MDVSWLSWTTGLSAGVNKIGNTTQGETIMGTAKFGNLSQIELSGGNNEINYVKFTNNDSSSMEFGDSTIQAWSKTIVFPDNMYIVWVDPYHENLDPAFAYM